VVSYAERMPLRGETIAAARLGIANSNLDRAKAELSVVSRSEEETVDDVESPRPFG
jgi:hypothetical protein